MTMAMQSNVNDNEHKINYANEGGHCMEPSVVSVNSQYPLYGLNLSRFRLEHKPPGFVLFTICHLMFTYVRSFT